LNGILRHFRFGGEKAADLCHILFFTPASGHLLGILGICQMVGPSQQKQEQKKGYYCTAVPYAFLFILYSNPKHLICFFLPVKLFSV